MFFRVWRYHLKLRRKTPGVTYLRHKEESRKLITSLVEEYALSHKFSYGRIAIRDTRRSWGSCSSKGNLNFSYKLAFLPPCLARYIVVHELCHLRHLHHGRDFWQEVESILPDYESRVSSLKEHERTRGTSVESLRAWQSAHDKSSCSYCWVDSRVV